MSLTIRALTITSLNEPSLNEPSSSLVQPYSNPNLDYDYILYMVLCYSTSNETDISNVRFSSSLLTLPSIRSSGHSNHVRWLLVHLLFSRPQPDMRKSPPVPSLVGVITPPPAHALQPVAHCNPLPLVWCHCCKSRSHPSRLNHNPQPWLSLLQMPESW